MKYPRLMILVLVGTFAPSTSRAAEPTAEELLKPTRLSLITAGSELAPVLLTIKEQTGNKLVDRTGERGGDVLPAWNFSLSDREFWPLLDKFLDAADLEPLMHSSDEGLPIRRRLQDMSPRFGKAVYVGPFRLEVTDVTSRLGTRLYGNHHASITLEIMWEPRLEPLAFAQSLRDLKMVADETTPVELEENVGELSIEVARDAHAVDMHIPLQLPPQQMESISSLQGKINTLVATRSAEFRFEDLTNADKVKKSQNGVTITLMKVRENQGLCELHMQVEFDQKLPTNIAQGSWNFQNDTYLEKATGERVDHAGFESLSQGGRTLGLAYFFDVPPDKLGEYTWVYKTPAGIVEVPIEFELKDVRLP